MGLGVSLLHLFLSNNLERSKGNGLGSQLLEQGGSERKLRMWKAFHLLHTSFWVASHSVAECAG